MNILIENSDTLEYLTITGHWTKNPGNGKRFPATQLAFRAAKLEAIGRFNIVCHIPQTNQFINLDHGRGRGLPETGAVAEAIAMAKPDAEQLKDATAPSTRATE